VIFISHKLDEVTAFCDEATVLRDGKTVASSVPIAEVDAGQLADLMVGSISVQQVAPRAATPGEVVLAVDHVTVIDSRGITAVDDMSLNVRSGEIVGIAGVAGNGQRQLTDTIAGLDVARVGTVTISGRDVTTFTTRQRVDAGLAYVPEDRLGVGLAPKLPITHNAVMRGYRTMRRGPMLSWDKARAYATGLIEKFEVKIGRMESPMASLSGGNLQRLLLGRELSDDPRVLVASQPTRGLDVAGVAAIQNLLLEQRDAGAGVLMVSEDLDELLALADRIIVMSEGQIAGEFDPKQASRTEIGEAMMGAQ